MTDVALDPVGLWRRPFFRTVSGMEDPGPLTVNWPAGDVVITVHTMQAVMAWCHGGQVTGLSKPTVVELSGHFSAPVLAFLWPLASAADRITSVKVNGQEQVHMGISGALFQKQPYTQEVRRLWWAWIPRLWERKDDDDDDD